MVAADKLCFTWLYSEDTIKELDLTYCVLGTEYVSVCEVICVDTKQETPVFFQMPMDG